MLSKFKTAALGVAIGLGAIAAVPAQADGLYLNFGGGGVEIRDGYDRDWRDDRWQRTQKGPGFLPAFFS